NNPAKANPWRHALRRYREVGRCGTWVSRSTTPLRSLSSASHSLTISPAREGTKMAAKDPKKVGGARSRRTKEDTQQEFTAIQREVEAAQEASDAKAAEVIRLREEYIRQAVDGIGVDAVVQRISGLGLEVSRSLSQVSGKLTEEVRLLSTVREAV